jgi:DnaK suppressor protein
MFSKEKIEYFKKILEEERTHLEKDMGHLVSPVDLNVEISDPNELADTFEELETRTALENKLEERLTFVNQALNRIKNGTYGYCQVCKEEIEEKRLKVNPVAKTCIKHAKG